MRPENQNRRYGADGVVGDGQSSGDLLGKMARPWEGVAICSQALASPPPAICCASGRNSKQREKQQTTSGRRSQSSGDLIPVRVCGRSGGRRGIGGEPRSGTRYPRSVFFGG